MSDVREFTPFPPTNFELALTWVAAIDQIRNGMCHYDDPDEGLSWKPWHYTTLSGLSRKERVQRMLARLETN